MDQERSEIVRKARAKQRRRHESKAANSSHKKQTGSSDASPGITEKMIDFGQGAAAHVGALVKTAVITMTGKGRKTAKRSRAAKS
jgi:hypothetical protein